MTMNSKHLYIDRLNDKADKYNNTYHRSIKMKPIDVKTNTHIDFDFENNDEDHKFEVGNHMRISRYKHIFTKVYTPNWPEEALLLKKSRILYCGCMLLVTNGEEIVGIFCEKEFQKTNQTQF